MSQGPLERETCRDEVLPALSGAGWELDDIREQYPVKAGRALRLGRVARDLGDGFVDYVLEVAQVPVAVVEAKRAFRSASDGVQQAVRYAQQLDVPLAYATNGADIIERDLVSGRERPVDSFATPAEAWSRYADLHRLTEDGLALQSGGFNRAKRLASGDVLEPRWYQAVAIRRVLTAMAKGERRVLLLMATGTGKTFTAMQIVHLLREHAAVVTPDRNYRVLYLADREALVDDPKDKHFSTAFGEEPLHRVSGPVNLSREIYFGTYQSLVQGDEDRLGEYRRDFFDLVIVDECHRGSASENSSWRRILDHFEPAVQLGLTATPKQDDTVDTYAYFGDPVFTYSLRQGIEEGYLAPYRVRRVTLSPDADGWEPTPGQRDRYGREKGRCRVSRMGSRGLPSTSTRPSTTPTGSTDGTPRRLSSPSRRYSCTATSSRISFAARNWSPTWMKRTTWREMPRGSATRGCVGQSASGTCQGSRIRSASGRAARNLGTPSSLLGRLRRAQWAGVEVS